MTAQIIKQILNIVNSEPFGMYPHKAEQIAEIIKADRNIYEHILHRNSNDKCECLVCEIQQTYTRLTCGEMDQEIVKGIIKIFQDWKEGGFAIVEVPAESSAKELKALFGKGNNADESASLLRNVVA